MRPKKATERLRLFALHGTEALAATSLATTGDYLDTTTITEAEWARVAVDHAAGNIADQGPRETPYLQLVRRDSSQS